ncbi:ATP-binding protein [Streptomyces sp. NPDC051105]|uniref:ATP-binding protein n=1 Tax=Streptomyces sp. NPDC051105 TaxID=3154843 RepID=UPI00343FDF50
MAHRPEAAGEARQIAKDVLARWQVADAPADSVLLTVSELVTNAVEHAEPPLNLRLSRDPSSHRVHIEVSDEGPAATDGDWAASSTPEEHGRGLEIIDFLATAHGDRLEHWAASCTPEEHGRGLEIIDFLATAHGDRLERGHAIHWADVYAAA